MTPIVVFTGKARSGKDTAAAMLCEEYGGVALAFADPIKRFLQAAYGLTEAQLWGDEKEKEFTIPVAQTHNLVNTLERVVGLALMNDLAAFNNRFAFWQRDYLPVGNSKTTPRRLMQTFGTEVVRAVRPDLWLEVGLRDAQRLLRGGMDYSRLIGVFPSNVSRQLVCITDGRFRNELLGVKQMGGLCVRIDRPVESGLSAEAKGHASEVEQASIPDWWYDARVRNDEGLDKMQRQVNWIGRLMLGNPEYPT